MKVKYEADEDKVESAAVSVLQAMTELTLEQKCILLKKCLETLKVVPVKY